MSYYDVKCPYCNEDQDINHDDGYGYEEDKTFQQECCCGKSFTFTTSISYYYEAEKAPCLNGESHKMKDVNYFPKGGFEYWRRCEWCDHEEIKWKDEK